MFERGFLFLNSPNFITIKTFMRIVLLSVLFFPLFLVAQDNPPATNPEPKGQLHGNFQVLWQKYNEDSLIGAIVPEAKSAMNAFGNLTYTNGDFSAGIRFEHYLNSILGFPGKFKGTGIGSRYARYKKGIVDITVGNFYEQFGSGMSLRTYWEPNLGIDNALDGVRIILSPIKGINIKTVYGHQRFDFDSKIINAAGLVRGIDGEIFINDLIKGWDERKTKITLGGSFVSKYQSGETIEKDSMVFDLPNNVGTSGARLGIIRNKFQINGEYVSKINDPNADNNFIYKKGKAIFVNTSFSTKGFGINFNAKFVDNMAFRSDRNALLFDVPINFLPAITRQHTYNLAATLYPYATVLNGEAGISGEVFYTFKKESKLGGKYGTSIGGNFAAVNNLDTTTLRGIDGSFYGYKTNSFGFGKKKYVRDFNVDLRKKITKDLNIALTYYYLEFDTRATPVSQDFKGLVFADIAVVEVGYKIKPKQSIRMELQTLFTKQDKGNWATGVFEYTFSPHWTFGVIDQYNFGNPNEDKRIHYLYGTAGYIDGSTRVSLGYGKRRQGIFCIGGVCRTVPASNGIEVTITTSF
jgi:Family of unknown function (DUF6029)